MFLDLLYVQSPLCSGVLIKINSCAFKKVSKIKQGSFKIVQLWLFHCAAISTALSAEDGKKEGGGDPLPNSFQEPRGYFKCSSGPWHPLPRTRQYLWLLLVALFLPASDMAMSAKAAWGHWQLQQHET